MSLSLDKIAILLSILATLATGGVFVYTELIYAPPLPSNEEGLSELKEDAAIVSIPVSFDIEKIVVNLRSYVGKRLRFLDLSLHIIPFDNSQLGILEHHSALIRDSIIDISGHMRPKELNTVAGKILFESRVKKSINERVGTPVVKKILFSKFVVQ